MDKIIVQATGKTQGLESMDKNSVVKSGGFCKSVIPDDCTTSRLPVLGYSPIHLEVRSYQSLSRRDLIFPLPVLSLRKLC